MRFQLYRVYLDRSGYERGIGTYYGIGQPIYRYCSDDCKEQGEFRAIDRETAKRKVKALYPTAKFYN